MPGDRTEFKRELEQLINRHSMEAHSNTPDWVLASYLHDCLTAFELAVRTRDRWYGLNPAPGQMAELQEPPHAG